MMELTADESRVLGVLIEKGQTTPDQYPLTLNAVVNGCNQKNNRNPVTDLDEDAVRSALIGLRGKGLIVQQDAPGQRGSRYRHQAKEGLGINTPEMVVLAELLMRGPQTLGELRGRASRMHPLDSLDMVKNVIEQLAAKADPMVKQIAPSPGSRAERYVQLLCPDLHPLTGGEAGEVSESSAMTGATIVAMPTTSQRVTALESEVQMLRAAIAKLAEDVGAKNPFEESAAVS